MTNDPFSQNLIAILATSLDPKSNILSLQDYIADGRSFIPVFTSIESFDESSGGQIGNEIIEIDGILLLSAIHGHESLKVNPGLESEQDFSASELKAKYAEEIARLKTEMDE